MPTLALPNPFRGLVSLIYPPFCAVCARAVGPEQSLCLSCTEKALRIKPPFCAKCSQPFTGAITGTFTCANCANRLLHFEAAVSAYRSRGVAREVVHRFKYGRQIHLRRLLGRWLAEALKDSRLASRRFDLVVPSRCIRRDNASAGLTRLSCWPRNSARQRPGCPQRAATDALHRHADAIRPERADGKSQGRLSFTARQQRARFADVVG